MGWQWHQLNHMLIICISLQTDNHTSTSSLILQARCTSCHSANSVKALKHWTLFIKCTGKHGNWSMGRIYGKTWQNLEKAYGKSSGKTAIMTCGKLTESVSQFLTFCHATSVHSTVYTIAWCLSVTLLYCVEIAKSSQHAIRTEAQPAQQWTLALVFSHHEA